MALGPVTESGSAAAGPDRRTPRISLCVLNYNYARFLGRAVESCLSQEPGDYQLVEIVVLDDGSTDESLEVCRRFGDRIRVMALPHGGFAATLTEAVRRSTGDWVAFLDADDWFAPAKLRSVVERLSPDVRFVQHWEYVVDGDGVALLPGAHPGGNTSTVVVHRATAASLLPVTNEKFFHVLDDLGLGARMAEPLTYYRVHSSNMTDRSTPGAHQDYMAGVCSGVAARLAELSASPPSWVDASALRRLSLHYRAEARAHEVEATLQRRRRGSAWYPLAAELVLTVRARRGFGTRIASVRSVLTGRPCVRLTPQDTRGQL